MQWSAVDGIVAARAGPQATASNANTNRVTPPLRTPHVLHCSYRTQLRNTVALLQWNGSGGANGALDHARRSDRTGHRRIARGARDRTVCHDPTDCRESEHDTGRSDTAFE